MTNKYLWLILPLILGLLLAAHFAACDDDDDDDQQTDDDLADDDAEDDDGDDDVTDDDATDDDTTVDDDADDDVADDDAGDDDTADDDTAVECETIIRGNLEWTQCDNGYDIDHYQAITYAESLDFAGYDDWRLPSPPELIDLYNEDYTQDTECMLPAHIVPPFHLSCTWIWTNKVTDWSDEIAYSVGFTHGTVTIDMREATERHRVLAVRDL